MRILTVIAGILTSAAGAFCFAVYQNAFSDLAFLVGMVMVVAGGCIVAAYLVSGRGKNRTTDTSLVEGLVTLLYGFAVLSNQITDNTLTLFFGTWLTLCGITRVSQSFYVSRFRPQDWAKIMPLAAIASMLGIVMMMPKLVSAVMPLMLLGGAFILDGLSMLIYAMFMKKGTITTSEAEAKAHERAEAKKALAAEERKERDRLRSMSKKEREEEQDRQKKKREEEEMSKRLARIEAKSARKMKSRPSTEQTIQFTPEESAEIKAADDKAEAAAEEKAKKKAAEKSKKNAENTVSAPDADAIPTAASEDDVKPEAISEEASQIEENSLELPATKPIWQKPTEIPSLRAAVLEERESAKEEDYIPKPLQFTAVNLEEIESKKPELEFEKVELPEFKLASEEETVSRDEVLSKIERTVLEPEAVDYTPIDLDELVAEPLVKPYDPEESKRFTQTLNFGWLNDNPEGNK